MATVAGVAHCISRLCACKDLSALKAAWGNFGVEYQRNELVQKVKDQMKAKLS